MYRSLLLSISAILIALSLMSCAGGRDGVPTERTVPDFTDAGVGMLITNGRTQLETAEAFHRYALLPLHAYINGSVTAYQAPTEEGWTMGVRTEAMPWNHFAGQAEMWEATSKEVRDAFIKALSEFYTASAPDGVTAHFICEINGLEPVDGTPGYTGVSVTPVMLTSMDATATVIVRITLEH